MCNHEYKIESEDEKEQRLICTLCGERSVGMKHQVSEINKTAEYVIKDVDEDDRIIRILASDESIDRDGDIISSKGWFLDNFLKSGSILYGHNPSILPVAKPISAEVIGKKLYVNAQFAEKGTSDFNDAVFSLIKQKILRGVSVGFKATEWEDIEGGRKFNKQELLELSVVPVPANANAMLQVKDYSDAIKKQIFIEKTEQEEVNTELAEVNHDEELLNKIAQLLKKIQ